MTHANPVGQIADLFAKQGAAEYLGEAVTQAAHMLQAAHLAEREGAHDALVRRPAATSATSPVSSAVMS
jgi:gamma-butyrobetaine dioxygenase